MGEGLLIYGAYGFTGSLITKVALESGLEPRIAGRRAEPLERMAREFGLEHEVFSLRYAEPIERAVADVDVVLNCAGPFAETTGPMVDACLEAGTHYLDIAGEVRVLESLAARDREAERAGMTVVPAVGFEVVPTDCLASHLETALPSATRLSLILDGFTSFSPGTVESMIAGADLPGATRRDGELRAVPPAWHTRRIAIDGRHRTAVTVPWGDVATAYYSTGIRNIETYVTVPRMALPVLRRAGPVLSLLEVDAVNRALRAVVDRTWSGPDEEDREAVEIVIVGEVEDDEGRRRAARVVTPDPYDVTARSATLAAARVLEGEVGPGFQTPSSAFGTGFAEEIEGIERADLTTTRRTVIDSAT